MSWWLHFCPLFYFFFSCIALSTYTLSHLKSRVLSTTEPRLRTCAVLNLALGHRPKCYAECYKEAEAPPALCSNADRTVRWAWDLSASQRWGSFRLFDRIRLMLVHCCCMLSDFPSEKVQNMRDSVVMEHSSFLSLRLFLLTSACSFAWEHEALPFPP